MDTSTIEVSREYFGIKIARSWVAMHKLYLNYHNIDYCIATGENLDGLAFGYLTEGMLAMELKDIEREKFNRSLAKRQIRQNFRRQ